MPLSFFVSNTSGYVVFTSVRGVHAGIWRTAVVRQYSAVQYRGAADAA
jgi:hypothetical protein